MSIGEDPVIHSLKLQQFSPWLSSPISRSSAEEVYQSLNLTVRSIFLYRIKDGKVTLLDKPGFKVRETFNDSSEPEPEGRFIFREEFIRANIYRDFFTRALAGSEHVFDILIAVDVNDAPIETADMPVFAFQKPTGSNTVLIPDVDFLHFNFYIPTDYFDGLSYADKIPTAIFAGSTTGGRTITAADVRGLAIPRLRAGSFFKGSDHVDFRIPRIVQCESQDVAAMIAALGINDDPCSWQEQFEYRFILSMDGNGATCSRVVIGLRSQSALMKYDSPQLLYYFGALIPWRHYMPISRDEDVPLLVEAERRHPSIFAQVAEEGRHFATRYLGRAGTCGYTRGLLSLYQSCLSDPRRASEAQVAVPEAPLPLVELGAHIQGIGDVWGWPGKWVGEIGSRRAIEAIAVVPTGIPSDAVIVRVVLDDGSLSNTSEFGGFCGTRGRDAPLRGFQVQVRDRYQNALSCTYSAHFTDGSQVGPLCDGEICRTTGGATLEAFYISVSDAPSVGNPPAESTQPPPDEYRRPA
jgi:Glycosyl transferase family 90